jgi:hypothetical protein
VAPVIAALAAAGAVTYANTTDILILGFEIGGSAAVLANDLTGASLLANLGGALSVTATTNKGHILAFDGGNAYLYYFIEGASGVANTDVAAGDIALIGVFNTVTLGAIGAANLVLVA